MREKKLVVDVTIVQSESDAARVYEVKTYSDGSKWCTCPAFRFAKGLIENRRCKHTTKVAGRLVSLQFAMEVK